MMRNREFGALVVITCLLLFFGLSMAYSASAPVGQKIMHDDYYYLKRMLLFAAVGLAGMIFAATRSYEIWTRYWLVFYVLSALGLLVVFTPLGVSAGESKRSFSIGFATVQPSEFARLTVVFFLASFCARRAEHLKNWKRGFVPAMAIMAVMTVLILAGHDLGIPVTIGLTALLMLFIGGASILHIAMTGGVALVSLVALILLEPYRFKRIITFIDPWKDPMRGGWQIIQSMAALGSGGVWGVGPGRGLQKYLYLPAAHTDFVFSIIGEEMGLVGTMIINLIFVSFAVVGTRIALKARSREASFLAIGISLMISITALINMAVTVDMLPTKGITLPFVSYGGSSLLSNMVAVGILMSIARSSRDLEALQSIPVTRGI
ncbi:putative lipid II flippase FtsW [Candidatus Poribacteria bacterium]|nr:putative lipid II flippase FtsW [Candidatus Poribacteria bacterium]